MATASRRLRASERVFDALSDATDSGSKPPNVVGILSPEEAEPPQGDSVKIEGSVDPHSSKLEHMSLKSARAKSDIAERMTKKMDLFSNGETILKTREAEDESDHKPSEDGNVPELHYTVHSDQALGIVLTHCSDVVVYRHTGIICRPIVKIKSVTRECQKHTPLKPGMIVLDVNGKSEFTIQEVLHDILLARENHQTFSLIVITDLETATNTNATIGTLHTCIVEAQGLPKMDYFGGADPYCAVFFSELENKQIKQTPFICRTTSPIFACFYKFNVNSMDELEKEMEFRVFDRDQYGNDDLIGTAKINLEFLWRLSNNIPRSASRADSTTSISSPRVQGTNPQSQRFATPPRRTPGKGEPLQRSPSDIGEQGSDSSEKDALMQVPARTFEDPQLPVLIRIFASQSFQVNLDELTSSMFMYVQTLGLFDGTVPENGMIRAKALESYMDRIDCQVLSFQEQRAENVTPGTWNLYFANCVGSAQTQLKLDWNRDRAENYDFDEAMNAPSRFAKSSPPPTQDYSLCIDCDGHPYYVSKDGEVLQAQPPGFVGLTVNSELAKCWYLDVWMDLNVSKAVMSLGQSRRIEKPRLHVQLLFESKTCHPVNDDINELMIEHDFSRIASKLCSNMTSFNAPADRARLQWQYESMVLRAYSVLVDPLARTESISPTRMWTIFGLMGENLDPDELADFFGEALYDENETAHTVDLLHSTLTLDALRLALGRPERTQRGPLKGGRRFRCEGSTHLMEDHLQRQKETVSSFIPEWAHAAMESSETFEPLGPDDRNGYELWRLIIKKLENSLLIQKWAAMDVDMMDRSREGIQEASTSLLAKLCTRNPEGFVANCWNFLQILLLVYVAFSVPISIGFDTSYEEGSFGWGFELFVDIYFIVDILLNFRTQYELANGVVVTDSRSIAINYVKGWFFLDILSCVSVMGYFMSSEGGGSGAESARLGKTLRIVRITKLLRLARLERSLNKMNLNIGPLIRGISLFIISTLCFHFFGCAWHYIGMNDDMNADGEPVYGWITFSQWSGGSVSSELYIESIFRAIYGFVDEAPTSFEMGGLVVLHFLINGIMYGMLTASLASLLVQMSASRQRFMERMECVRDWLSMRQISASLRNDVYDFFVAKYSSEKIFDEQELMSEISPSPIAGMLVREMYADIIAAVPLFRGLPDEIVTKLCMGLTPIPVLANHSVYEQNELADEMYILIQGSLQVTKRQTGSNAPNYTPRMKIKLVRHGMQSRAYCCNSMRFHYTGWIARSRGAFEQTLEGSEVFKEITDDAASSNTFLRCLAPSIEVFVDFDERRGSTGYEVKEDDVIEVLAVRSGDVLGYLGPGAYFGETGLEASTSGSLSRRVNTVTAMVDSELAYMRTEDLTRLRDQFPVLRKHIQKYQELRRKLELPKLVFNVIDQDDDGSIEVSELYELMFQLDKVCPNKKINLVSSSRNSIEPWWDQTPGMARNDKTKQGSNSNMNENAMDFLRLPIDERPHVVEELYERASWPADRPGRVLGNKLQVVDQSSGKWHNLINDDGTRDLDCAKMLRALQSSHSLVHDAVQTMDRDLTGDIEYAEFLGWWITNTASTCQEVAQEVAWDVGSDEEADEGEGISMTDIDNRFNTIEETVEQMVQEQANMSAQQEAIATQVAGVHDKLDQLLSQLQP